MGGKSNKFDYTQVRTITSRPTRSSMLTLTQRKSSGVTLGNIIAKDLLRLATKPKKSAATLPALLRRPEKVTDPCHKLDLKAPGRSLGDEGLCALANGLQQALASSASLYLVDINLHDNTLTAQSLARLAPILILAKTDIQTLDLSNNNIRVTNEEEARDWEYFLRSFQSCRSLRRLDISNNPDLGSWALEILARVHIQEKDIDSLRATGSASVYSLAEIEEEDRSVSPLTRQAAVIAEGLQRDSLDNQSIGKGMTAGCILPYRCGLRSIPYITLRNIGLDDTGALFLSYMLEDHYYPIQLITEHNAAEALSSIRTYQQDSSDKGIDVDKNDDTLTRDGVSLLRITEDIRKRKLLGDSMASSMVLVPNPTEAAGQHGGSRRVVRHSSS